MSYFYVPLETAIVPITGHCYVDKYWCLHPDKGLVFYLSHHYRRFFNTENISPQCNDSEHICRMLLKGMKIDEFDVVQVNMVFMGNIYRAAKAFHDSLYIGENTVYV